MRPNFWPNTPDILRGRCATDHRPRSCSASCWLPRSCPSYGIYSGYELCENQPASDSNEEYLDSEKYEIKRRDWNQPGSLAPFIRGSTRSAGAPGASPTCAHPLPPTPTATTSSCTRKPPPTATRSWSCREPRPRTSRQRRPPATSTSRRSACHRDGPSTADDELDGRRPTSWHGPRPLGPPRPAAIGSRT